MRLTTRRRRSARAILGRMLVVRTACLLVAFLTVVVGQGLGTTLSSDEGIARPLDAAPSWTPADTAHFPGCVPSRQWAIGAIPSSLVVVRYRDDARVRLGFDAAWALNHNATESDDVLVLGSCG